MTILGAALGFLAGFTCGSLLLYMYLWWYFSVWQETH